MERLKNNVYIQYTLGIIIAIIPALYFYYTKVEDIQQNKNTLTSTITVNQSKLSSINSKKENLEELRSKLTLITSNLNTIKKTLPDNISSQYALQIISKLANVNNITLENFQLREEVPSSDSNYVKVPINISITGTYKNILIFYDQLTHLKQMLHLVNLKIDSKSQFLSKDQVEPLMKSSCNVIIFRGV